MLKLTIMRKEYDIKFRIFDDQSRIYLDDKQVGFIKHRISWGTIMTCKLFDLKYDFRRPNMFSSTIKIINQKTDETIGTITYGTFVSKINVTLNGKEYTLKPIKHWRSIWGLYNDNNEKITSTKGGFYKNTVREYQDNTELVLISIFLRQYLSQYLLMAA